MGKIDCLEILLSDSSPEYLQDYKIVLEKITGSTLNLDRLVPSEDFWTRELIVGNKSYRVVVNDYIDGTRIRIVKMRGFGSREVAKVLRIVSKTNQLSLRVGKVPDAPGKK
jgi:hypothetical protein